MAELKVTLDGSKLEKWATELSARGLKNAIRRAVDRSATAARKAALEVIASDIGVPKARLRTAVTKVKRTTQTNLTASFTANKAAINMLATGATVARVGGMHGSTYRLTGGTSASLKIKDAFLVHANGGTFIAVRRSNERLPIKGVFAETPSYALGRGKANKDWQKEANAQLAQRLPQEIQKQLLAEGLPYSAPPDTD